MRAEFLNALLTCPFDVIVDSEATEDSKETDHCSCLDWLNRRGIVGLSKLILRRTNISCDALIRIMTRCPAIKYLYTGRRSNDCVLITLSRHCRDLRPKFDLLSNPLGRKSGGIITVTGIRSLLVHSKHLECCSSSELFAAQTCADEGQVSFVITVAQSPQSLEIRVVDLKAETRAVLQIQPVDTVTTIQRQICEQTGIRPEQHRLMDNSSINLFVDDRGGRSQWGWLRTKEEERFVYAGREL